MSDLIKREIIEKKGKAPVQYKLTYKGETPPPRIIYIIRGAERSTIHICRLEDRSEGDPDR